MDHEDDAALVKRVLEGDRDAFRFVVDKYGGAVAGVAFAVLGDMAAAREVAVETLGDAYVALSNLNNPNALGSWLVSIARHKAIYRIRRAARSKTINVGSELHESEHLNATGVGETPERSSIRREARMRVIEEVMRLQEKYREVVVLRYVEGKSYVEIAKLLSVSFAVVDKRLTRAKAQLRQKLGDLTDLAL